MGGHVRVLDSSTGLVSDAFAYDKLAVEQTTSDASDDYILVGSSSDSAGDYFPTIEPVIKGEMDELGDIALLGTADALATSDFYLI